MKIKYILLGIIAFFYSTLGWHGLSPSNSSSFEKIENGRKEKVTLTLEPKSDHLRVKSQNSSCQIVELIDQDGQLYSYKYISNDDGGRFFISRQNEMLSIKGKMQGKPIRKNFAIKERLWVQDFAFGLKPFLESKTRRIDFLMIDPKDFNLVKLRARKYKLQTIVLNGKDYKTQKVMIYPKGLKGIFTKNKLWYDIRDHSLLRYEGKDYISQEDCTIALSK